MSRLFASIKRPSIYLIERGILQFAIDDQGGEREKKGTPFSDLLLKSRFAHT